MRRSIVLGVLLAAGWLAVAFAGGQGQKPPQTPLPEAVKVKDNL